MWPWRVKMPTQNLLRLLLLVMLMLKDMLTTIWCRCGSWSLVIKLNFCSDFEHKVWSITQSWNPGKIVKLRFGQYIDAGAWLKLWGLILVKILKLGFVNTLNFRLSQSVDVWLRFWSLGKLNSTIWSIVPLAVFYHPTSTRAHPQDLAFVFSSKLE